MRILLSATAYPPSIGGGQSYAHELMVNMVEGGHLVQVISSWDTNRTDWLLGTTLKAPEAPRVYSIDGVSVTRLGIPSEYRLRWLPWVTAFFLNPSLASRQIGTGLRHLIEGSAERAEIVHNVRMGRAPLSEASLQLSRRWDVPFALSPLHHHRWSGWQYRHYHRIYRNADLVLALTPTEQRTLVGMGVQERRIAVTGMGPVIGSDPQPERFRAKYAIEGPVVLFLGQKFQHKNLEALLAAAQEVWKANADTHFIFIGPGTPHSEGLFRRIRHPRILELGSVSLEEKTDALAACDLVCVPSSQESFGAVFLEAWMAGKPVIAGPAPALDDVVDDGVDGCRVQPDAEQIADRILELLRDEGLRERMGARGRQKTLERFTWDLVAERTQAAYRRTLEGNL